MLAAYPDGVVETLNVDGAVHGVLAQDVELFSLGFRAHARRELFDEGLEGGFGFGRERAGHLGHHLSEFLTPRLEAQVGTIAFVISSAAELFLAKVFKPDVLEWVLVAEGRRGRSKGGGGENESRTPNLRFFRSFCVSFIERKRKGEQSQRKESERRATRAA